MLRGATRSFTFFPAIDLRRGRCVRLERGMPERETIYDPDPSRVLDRFAAAGAEWVHLVDLDAAFGEGSNRETIRALTQSTELSIQTGGGLRDERALYEVLETGGVARVVLGTAAIEDPDLVARAVDRWGPERIAVGLDARGSRPAVRGWQESTAANIFDVGRSLVQRGVSLLIYTDIERDGMLSGPNVSMAQRLARESGADVVVSGGIAELADLEALVEASRSIEGIVGAISGKAIYEGRLDLRSALACARGDQK